MILVYDRLIRDGHDPSRISATITDRAAANVAKTQQLLGKLATTRGNIANGAKKVGISAQVEDLFELDTSGDDRPHVVTLVDILEYFHGFTHTTTEEYHGLAAEAEEKNAQDVLRRIGEMTAESGTLIANSYRTEMGARLLEVFGKRIRYRNREHVQALVETAGFVPTGRVGSGIVYDVEAFEKRPSQESAAQTNDVET